MPVLGQKPKYQGYVDESMKSFAQAFKDLNSQIMSEGADLFMQPQMSLMNPSVDASLKNFFVENSFYSEDMSPEEKADATAMMEAQYDNDRDAVLEYATMGSYNPVIGLTFPMHKLLLMNCIFDNGKGIEKCVAKSPKFTVTMQNRYLVKPDGTKLDLSLDQLKLTDAIDSTRPEVPIELTLPETGTTNILEKINGVEGTDNLSIDTRVAAVKVSIKYKKGDVDSTGTEITEPVTKDDWIPVSIEFKPSYNNQFQRSFIYTVDFSNCPYEIESTVKQDTLTGTMHNNRLTIMATSGQTGATPVIKAVKVLAKKDASNGLLETCTTTWETTTTLVEIENATPINVPISSEEIKDVGALYNVNQLTMTMGMINDVLKNYKDDKIRKGLDDSWEKMPASQKRIDKFDFCPREGYAFDNPEWRNKGFMDILDTHVTKLYQILNDPNVSVSIYGATDLIRKVSPIKYDFQTPSTIGPVELEYERTVVTSNRRVYNFMSSQKLNDREDFIVILRPRNTNRIIYRIYDYQMFVSNEIRNAKYYTLPAVSAYERFKFFEYQPVQGKFLILNPTGFKEA